MPPSQAIEAMQQAVAGLVDEQPGEMSIDQDIEPPDDLEVIFVL